MKTFIAVLSLTLTFSTFAESAPLDSEQPHTTLQDAPKKAETHQAKVETTRAPAQAITEDQREAGPAGRLR